MKLRKQRSITEIIGVNVKETPRWQLCGRPEGRHLYWLQEGSIRGKKTVRSRISDLFNHVGEKGYNSFKDFREMENWANGAGGKEAFVKLLKKKTHHDSIQVT